MAAYAKATQELLQNPTASSKHDFSQHQDQPAGFQVEKHMSCKVQSCSGSLSVACSQGL